MKVSQLVVTVMYFSHKPGKEFAYNENIFSKLKQNTVTVLFHVFQGRFGG